MPWQEVIDHINGSRVRVESKSGRKYPAKTEYDHLNQSVYKWAMGDLAQEEMWAWVEFPEDGIPVVEDLSAGHPDGGPPEKPPWEH